MNIETGRILLVDHSRGALTFQETILRRRDSIILTALAGTEGLQKAQDELPHLIIFGFDLFDMTAPEFCREIRNQEATRMTSLLLIADKAHPEHGDLCLSAGCNDVIFRPIQRRELDAKVDLLAERGTSDFLLTSLKLYGRPEGATLKEAETLLAEELKSRQDRQ